MALVEMGVNIDQTRQNDFSGAIDRRQAILLHHGLGHNPRDQAIPNQHGSANEVITARRRNDTLPFGQ
jgi:hypothetical protein